MSCKTGDHRSIDDFVVARLSLLAERRRRSKKNFSKKVEKFSKYFPSALED
jgi:hypothetical protein